MPKQSLSAAFAVFGAKGKNSRWSWSARTPDGRIVITFWQDQFSGRPLAYSNVGRRVDNWKDNPGNAERIENIRYAQSAWDSRVGVVIVRAHDVSEIPRAIAEANARLDLLMKITFFDEATGEFTAENVGTWSDLRPL